MKMPTASGSHRIFNACAAAPSVLDALARLCGVSRAMLAQIESGRSVPSIKVLCKIAKGLKVSVAAFLEHRAFEGVAVLSASQSKRLVSASGTFVSRALFPYDVARQSEFYELRLSPLGEDQSEGHGPGVQENLVVAQGCWKSASTMSAICFPPGIRFCFMPTSPIAIATPPTVKRWRTWW
jgi:transcriptional regulator with XRE-family HTH domain